MMSARGDECGGRGEFTFVWTIQNFRHCVVPQESELESATFSALNTEWHLSLYPRGNTDNNIECSLKSSQYSKGITVDCEMCVCTTNGERFGVDKKENMEFARNSRGTHIAIFDFTISEHLAQDTLVIHCHLWKSGSDRTETSVHCHELIRIDVQKKTLFWNIEEFSSLQLQDEKMLCLKPVESDLPTLTFRMSLDGSTIDDARLQITILFEDIKFELFFTCYISLLRYDGTSMKFMSDEQWLDSDGEVIFPHFLTRLELMADRTSYLPGDVLTLKCEVTLSDDQHCIEQVVYDQSMPVAVDIFQNRLLPVPRLPDQDILRGDLGLLYEDGTPYDFELSAGGRAFPVHRLLLCARSHVFRNMLQNDMIEKHSNTLCVPDVGPDILDHMLRYLYTDVLPDIGWQDAALLYYAADKYQLLDLRQRCSVLLGNRLDPENMAEVLTLADRHQDSGLIRAVQDFVLNRGKTAALDSDGWKLLEVEDPRLAVELMRHIPYEKVLVPTPEEIEQCGKTGFSFVWKIENFSHFAETRGSEILYVTFFTLDMKWWMSLFPARNREHDTVCCSLKKKLKTEVAIDCKVCICTTNGERLGVDQKQNTAIERDSWETPIAYFDRQISKHLPQDTLVIHCHLWKSGSDRTETLVHCNQLTGINVQKRTFFWSIEGFSTLLLKEEKVFCMKTVEVFWLTLTFKISLTGTTVDDARLQIVLDFKDVEKKSYFTCSISVLDHEGNKIKWMSDNQGLNSDGQVIFPPFLTRRDLMADRTSYLPGDILTLLCEIAFSDGHYHIEEVVYGQSTRVAVDIFHKRLPPVPRVPEHTLKGDLELLYEEGAFSDFELSAGGRAFPVHRLLLGARSPVFRNMFQNDTLEKDSLCIPDLDPDTLDRMLRYIYTGGVPYLRWQDAARLYYAADKYQLQNLRQRCSALLGDRLNPENADVVAALADQHRDSDLKEAVQEFSLSRVTT